MVELNPRMWNVPLPDLEFLPEDLCSKYRERESSGQPDSMRHVLSCVGLHATGPHPDTVKKSLK